MEVAVDIAEFDPDDGFLVKLWNEELQLNIRITAEQLARLGGIREANWDERRSIRAGESAGSPVFWAC